MITPPSFIKNSTAAARYFDSHLSSGDYYEQEGKCPGVWFGAAADELGLKGVVTKGDFLAMSKNIDPRSGEQLTMRQNSTRGDDKEANRRCAQDFCIAPPKSVSIQAMVHGDKRIIEAHNRAVLKAAAKMEEKASARVRKFGMNKSRITGNAAVAIFQHDTSRAAKAGGVPDPQLHSHMIFFNATKDADGSWKALENKEMMKIKSYADAIYDHALLGELHAMGYSIREKGESWELSHIEESTIKKFSKRRSAIVDRTEALAAQGAKRDFHDLKNAVAHDERIRKDTSATSTQLRESWGEQLDEMERKAKPLKRNYDISMSPKESVRWAKNHCFERSAVVSESDIMAAALRHAKGSKITEKELTDAIESDQDFLRAGTDRVTTKQVFETEKFCIDSVRRGNGKYTALAPGLLESSASLTPIQRSAAETIISSRDFAVLFRGGAGTGKSFTLKAIKNALDEAGKDVHVLAPQNRQVGGLKTDGFENARTISNFLGDDELVLNSDSILIIDESGQISGQDMAKIIRIAKDADARIIFSGDTRQHGAVAATDALIAIEKYALPTVADLAGEEAIQRQKVSWYKFAVFAASEGKVSASYEILDTQGAIIEIEKSDDESHRDARAREVAKLALKKEGSVLIVTQTNAEVSVINEAVRAELILSGKLDRSTEQLIPILTAKEVGSSAEHSMAGSYDENTRIIFNRQISGTKVKAGDIGRFIKEGEHGSIIVEVGGKKITVPASAMDRLSLVQKGELQLCIGDTIQLKGNCRFSAAPADKLANGTLMTFRGLDKDGNILAAKVDEPTRVYTLQEGFRQIRYGYALTSYSSQGATVDHVIISDSASQMATSQKQFYVSISRGRQSCTILTSDKDQLKEHIQNLGERELATDLVKKYGPFKKSKAVESDLPQPAITQRIRAFLHGVPGFLTDFADRGGEIFRRGAGLMQSLLRVRDRERLREHGVEMEM